MRRSAWSRSVREAFGRVAMTLLAGVALAVRPPCVAADRPDGIELLQAFEGAISQVIEDCERSVVSIVRTSLRPEQLARQAAQLRAQPFGGRIVLGANGAVPAGFEPFQMAIAPPKLASGAGVVIDESGLILTQYGIVKLGETHLVTDLDGNRYEATIRAADPRSGLAVLAIGKPLERGGAGEGQVEEASFKALPIGDAETLRKGRFIVAIGNPFSIESDGQPTASWGAITNTALKVPTGESLSDATDVDGGFRTTLHHFGSLIQTDAKLGWNASGGALVNLDGQLVGIVTTAAAIAGHEQPAGYAIPMNEAMRRAVRSMCDGREPEYGLLGVGFGRGVAVNPLTGRRGIEVTRAYRGGPAQRAGVRVGDLLLRLDDVDLSSIETLQLAVGSLPPGEETMLTYERGGEVAQSSVKLGKAFIEQGQIVTRQSPSWRGIRVDFSTAVPPGILDQKARDGHLDEQGCVVVAEVDEGSVSWKSGVRPFCFISHVGGQRVATPSEFYDAVKEAGDNVKLKFTKPLPALEKDNA